MSMSKYMRDLRAIVGDRLIIVPASVVFLFDQSARMLSVRDVNTELWGVPGGAIERGESPEQAARRELKEETGLTAGRLTLLGTYGGTAFEVTHSGGDRTAYVVVSYGTVEWRGYMDLQEDEVGAAKWIGMQDLRGQPFRPEMGPMAEDAFKWIGHKRRQDGTGALGDSVV